MCGFKKNALNSLWVRRCCIIWDSFSRKINSEMPFWLLLLLILFLSRKKKNFWSLLKHLIVMEMVRLKGRNLFKAICRLWRIKRRRKRSWIGFLMILMQITQGKWTFRSLLLRQCKKKNYFRRIKLKKLLRCSIK